MLYKQWGALDTRADWLTAQSGLIRSVNRVNPISVTVNYHQVYSCIVVYYYDVPLFLHKVNITIQIACVLKGRFNRTTSLQQYDCVKMGFGDMCVVNFGQTHQLPLCADNRTCPQMVCNTYFLMQNYNWMRPVKTYPYN